MRDFRKLRVWHKAHGLTLAVYEATRQFPREELFGLTSQTRRASISIGANIAEGCGRTGRGEFLQFLNIAFGSASELEYHLLLAADLHLMDRPTHDRLNDEIRQVKKMLTSLMQTIRQDPRNQSTSQSRGVPSDH
jgi:four helix bundle protein